MRMNSLRVLPLLVIVAMLAFSVRLAEVVTGFSTLGGAAVAEEAKKPEEAKAAETHADDAAKHAPPVPAAPEIKEADAPPPEKGPEWVDSEDSDTQFSSVRHELYDNLAQRRTLLDKRENDLVTREALLKAGEKELDRKFQELSNLRGEIEKLLTTQSEEEKTRIQSLVKIYEGMKPKDAARIFDTLDLDILVNVMSNMSERKLSPILAQMNPERARTITIMLAEQKQLPALPPTN